MVFEIKNKVAIITGGASGIGLRYAKELLRNGAKAVTLADINEEISENALTEIEKEFGVGKAIFAKTNVTNIQEFEDAFIKTIEHFKNVDILFNNAGIMNDTIWETEVAINVKGTINGMLLGLEKYLPKYKQADEALIVNVSSTLGTKSAGFMPIYSGTKHAILGLTHSWGQPDHFDATKVRVVAVCPSITMTPLADLDGKFLGERYEDIFRNRPRAGIPPQKPEFVAKEVMEIVKNAPNGTFWIIELGRPAIQFDLPDRRTMKNNILKGQR